jgi:hypothetical protein
VTLCAPGEGACPLDIDCVGSWSSCTAGCGTKTYAVTTAASGQGDPCPVVHGSTLACNDGVQHAFSFNFSYV